jgi:IS30 family transposase
MALPALPGAKAQRFASGRERRGQIPDRRSVTEQPESIDRCTHIGQGEGDNVVGAAYQRHAG